MREIRLMPSALDLDILRHTLGPTLVAPYARAFGAVPWLTAGTLTWPAADARAVAEAWNAWAGALPDHAPTALRVTGAVVAVDVALPGDPAGALTTLAPLRALGPQADSAGLASPAVLLGRAGGTPAPVAGAAVPLGRRPTARALLAVAAQAPEGVGLGVRRDAAGAALIGLGIAAEAARVRAAVDRAARGLELPAARVAR
jgi:hypothetical protein